MSQSNDQQVTSEVSEKYIQTKLATARKISSFMPRLASYTKDASNWENNRIDFKMIITVIKH